MRFTVSFASAFVQTFAFLCTPFSAHKFSPFFCAHFYLFCANFRHKCIVYKFRAYAARQNLYTSRLGPKTVHTSRSLFFGPPQQKNVHNACVHTRHCAQRMCAHSQVCIKHLYRRGMCFLFSFASKPIYAHPQMCITGSLRYR